MPVANGLEATRRIREHEREAKAEKPAYIIALTGAERSLQSGCCVPRLPASGADAATALLTSPVVSSPYAATAHASEEDRRECLSHEMDAFMCARRPPAHALSCALPPRARGAPRLCAAASLAAARRVTLVFWALLTFSLPLSRCGSTSSGPSPSRPRLSERY